jgi:hypothetical protein
MGDWYGSILDVTYKGAFSKITDRGVEKKASQNEKLQRLRQGDNLRR